MASDSAPGRITWATWFYVSTPAYTIGVEVEDDRIIGAAPIARWAIGKKFEFYKAWLHRKIQERNHSRGN